MHLLSKEKLAIFYKFDKLATFFFVIDIVFNLLVDEHNTATEGFWTIRKSVTKLLRGSLLLDLLATFPFASIFKSVLDEK